MAKVLLLLAICLLAAAKRPGVKMALSHDAIEYWKNNWLPSYIAQFRDIEIPAANTTVGNGMIKAEISVHDMFINDTNVDALGSSVTFMPNDQVILIDILDLTTTVSLEFLVDTGFIAPISGNGYFKILIGDIRFGIHTDIDSKGKPIFSLSEALINITSIDLVIEGSVVGDIITWAVGVIKDVALANIEGALSGAVLSEGNRLLQQLAENTVTVLPIEGTNLAVDYTLQTGNIVQDNYLELASAGLVMNLNLTNPDPPIPEAVKLPDFNKDGDQVQLWVTEYTLNSLSYAAFTDGLISDVIPAEVLAFNGKPLTTKALSLAIPQLAKKYGEDALVDLGLRAVDTAPNFDLRKDWSAVQFSGEVSILVRQELQQVKALVMNTTLELTTSLYVEDWTLKGKIDSFTISKISIVESSIGDLSTTALSATLNIAVQLGLGVVNSYLSETGLPLPQISQNVDFNQTNLIIEQGYLEIDATPKWNPVKEGEVFQAIVARLLALS